MPAIFDNPEFWVLIAFLIFAGMLVSMKVPATVGKALDDRAAGIRKDLDDAARLRKEAEQLLPTTSARHVRQRQRPSRSSRPPSARPRTSPPRPRRRSPNHRAPHQAGRGQDRPRRGASCQRSSRDGRRRRRFGGADSLKAKLAGATATGLVEQSIRDLKGKLN